MSPLEVYVVFKHEPFDDTSGLNNMNMLHIQCI